MTFSIQINDKKRGMTRIGNMSILNGYFLSHHYTRDEKKVINIMRGIYNLFQKEISPIDEDIMSDIETIEIVIKNLDNQK